MHKTLFTSSMVETFRTCKRAYRLASMQYRDGSAKAHLKSICKRFILKGLADINRGKLTTVNQVQKFMGQSWPADKLSVYIEDKDKATRAFLFAYKTLTRYVGKPYKPEGAETVAAALRVRARVPHVRVYVEDTIDMILWYPEERRLEMVDYQVRQLPHFDPLWPSPEALIKQFLADKLKMRWPFEKLTLTFIRVGVEDYQPISITLDEAIFRLHWSELVQTLEEMKTAQEPYGSCETDCQHCTTLEQKELSDLRVQEPFSMTA